MWLVADISTSRSHALNPTPVARHKLDLVMFGMPPPFFGYSDYPVAYSCICGALQLDWALSSSTASTWTILAWTSKSKWWLHCSELAFSLLPICLILLRSHWCKRNKLGLEWWAPNFCNGNNNLRLQTRSSHGALQLWLSHPLVFSPSMANPNLSPCLPLLLSSFSSNLQPFARRRLGARFWGCSLGDFACSGRTVAGLVGECEGLLFPKVKADGLLLIATEEKEKKWGIRLGRELQRSSICQGVLARCELCKQKQV